VSDLADPIATARADLAERADGQLVRGLRHAILRALGDGPEGRARRARLARRTVEHVLPLWEDERPGDHDPERALALIDAVLDGGADEAEVARVAGELWAHVDNLVVTAGREAPLHVGYAASRALSAALRDEPLDSPGGDPQATDQGRDPRRLDTAFMASGAVAGGPPWKPGTDAQARHAFWTWWLDQAAAAPNQGRP
jgi:Immunity protein Imm5